MVAGCQPNHWLTVIAIDGDTFGATATQVLHALNDAAIEARPGFKPMHQQPVFADAPMLAGRVSDHAARTTLCLPSSGWLTDAHVDEICATISRVARRQRIAVVPDTETTLRRLI